MTVYYRYWDMQGSIYLAKCPVVKETPCGVWVADWDGESAPRHFVNKNWTKRYAHATVEEARKAFIARKRRQIAILGMQLEYAKEAKRRADAGKWDEPEVFQLTVDVEFEPA